MQLLTRDYNVLQIPYKEVLVASGPLSENILNLAINKDSLMTSNGYQNVLLDNSPLPQSIVDQITAGKPTTMNTGHRNSILDAQ